MTEQPPATPPAVNADATEFEQISRSAAVPGSLAAAFWARYDTIVAERDALRRKVDELRAGAVPDTPDPSAVIAAAIAYADSPDEPRDTPSEDALLDAVHEYREAGGAVPDTGHPAPDDRIKAVVRAASNAFRAYTGTREGEPMWILDMEATWRIIAPAVLAAASPSGDTAHTPDVSATVAGSPVEASLAEIRTWLADDTPYCILPVRREHLPAVLARLDELEQQAAEMATRVEMPTGTEFVAKYFTPDLMSAVNETPSAPGAEDLFAVHPSPSVGEARERIADPAAYFERVRGAAEAALTAARAARARPSDGDPGLPLSALFDNRDPHQDEMRAGTAADEHGPVYVKPDEELPHA